MWLGRGGEEEGETAGCHGEGVPGPCEVFEARERCSDEAVVRFGGYRSLAVLDIMRVGV